MAESPAKVFERVISNDPDQFYGAEFSRLYTTDTYLGESDVCTIQQCVCGCDMTAVYVDVMQVM